MAGIAGKIFTLASIVFALLASSACTAQAGTAPAEHWTWGTVAEDGVAQAQIDEVRLAFVRNDFAALDAIEARDLANDGKTPSGGSKLTFYYDNITYLLSKYDPLRECNADWQPFLDKWRAASPRSPAPIVANAAMLYNRAWCYRGSGYAGAVSDNAWKPFSENIEAAAALLRKEKAIASTDPEYYAQLESLLVAQGASRADFRHVLDEATGRYPYYFNIYFAAYQYYQPQWYGSDGDIDALARYMVQKTSARDGKADYFRFYWDAASCNCREHLAPADLPTMRAAMDDLAQRYPVDRTYIHIVQMACMLGDADDAKRYFARVTINEAAYWREADWDECRALVGSSPLPFPQPTS